MSEPKIIICPRCAHTPLAPGAWARSRVADARICLPCGQSEALADMIGQAPRPAADWPVPTEALA